jgi:hypothetical protein
MTTGCDAALNCLRLSFSPLPIRPGSKNPSLATWKIYQQRCMSPDEVKQHFRNECNIALIGGAVSGHLECLDFDRPDLFQPFFDTLEGVNPELKTRLTLWQETPSGGYHLLYRCSVPIGGSQKLAMSAKYNDEQGRHRQDTFIETKSEGGYFLIAPSECVPKEVAPDAPRIPYKLHGTLEDIRLGTDHGGNEAS